MRQYSFFLSFGLAALVGGGLVWADGEGAPDNVVSVSETLSPAASPQPNQQPVNNSTSKSELEKSGLYPLGGTLLIDRNVQIPTLAVSTITAVSSATITNLSVTTLNAWPFQAPVQATSVTGTSTTSSTFQATLLTATITPISASHRIKITVCGDIRSANTVASNAIITIKRGSTDLGPASALGGFAVVSGAGGNLYNDVGVTYIDSPATTSATTYTVYLKNGDNATTVKFGELTAQVMTLEEIL